MSQAEVTETLLMSAKPPKAEVAIHGADVRYVPIPEVSASLWQVGFAEGVDEPTAIPPQTASI